MMSSPKKLLPIGIETFEKISSGRYYYVDKTPLLIKLLNTSEFVFLSRPRRFGKSLTMDTIAQLFAGRKELFTGLYAEENWNWEETYPVIHLSFAGQPEKGNVPQLREMIGGFLEENARRFNIPIDEKVWEKGIGYAFRDLIQKTNEQHQKPVVILIDEYDKPIIDNLSDTQIAEEIRSILTSLYSQLKACSGLIRFAMLTGVSKFAQMSLFSGLNNLRDISLEAEYSALCGYTQKELERFFAPELVGVDLEEVKRWYNGYNWRGESVYNPFDVLLFLASSEKEFLPHWFSTGGNTHFLFDLMKAQSFNMLDIQQPIDPISLMNSNDIGNLPVQSVLFQSGYLTIDQVIRDEDGVQYLLKFPNVEVRQSFTKGLLDYMVNTATQPYLTDLKTALNQGDIEKMQMAIRSAFAALPYQWTMNTPIPNYEGYWASCFYMFFASRCVMMKAEDTSARGRADLVVVQKGNVYIFEFKTSNNGDAQSALAQIREKRYADAYRANAQRIFEIGVSFNTEAKEVKFAVQKVS
ncbi:ATP-binding protein [Pelistega europaea]|uniref:ATP-binding protein n=1 Tax=Pelistega europaea TaxID=106147 RepID=A0A7Y4P6T9_9BURK|nr:ATP-binding protein [Pelistega europaea]NOL50264.1 ATP-binding protein [Pelistega europaea]